MDATEEDLSESVTVDSVEEVKALQAAHESFQSNLTTPSNDFHALAVLAEDIKSKGVETNPYTPFTIAAISDKWKAVNALIADRTDLLSKEHKRQEENDNLRKKFADKAIEFNKTLTEIR